jgi:hypothetical protein
MASETLDREGWFVEVRLGFPDVLHGFRAFLVLR